MIILDGIYKTYSVEHTETEALKNVSLCIEKGSFCSIVGASGSGKSTLLNIIGCLDSADRGNYFLDNEEITRVGYDRLSYIRNNKIGFVFQNFNLIKNLNIVENVELPLMFCGYSQKRRREMAVEAIEKIGLSARMYHKPNELSGGQQQKVAIARAIIKNPPVILADEPTGNLDPVSGEEVMNILRSLNCNGSTVLMITHDMRCAEMTDRIIKIKEGEIK